MKISPRQIAAGFVLCLAAYLSNFRSMRPWQLHPRIFLEQASIELLLWLLIGVVVFWLLDKENRRFDFSAIFTCQPWLLALPVFAAMSIGWSVNPEITANRASILLAATWVAAFIGFRHKVETLLGYMSILAAGMLIAALYMVVFDPLLGVSRFYQGAWRGIFWHKNHLGPLAALSAAILLLQMVELGRQRRWWKFAACSVVYLLALLVALKSRSAAAYFLVPILHALIGGAMLWRSHRQRIEKRHYWLAFVLAGAIAVLLLIKLELVFGLFNKDVTMTGRTKLWAFIINEYVDQRPMLGYGFNAMWGDSRFQSAAYDRLNFVPVIGDNGFLDIVLGLGIIGLVLFLVTYLAAWWRSIRMLVKGETLASSLPLVLMVFSLFANISYSFLLEIEVFVWGWIVIILTMSSRKSGTQLNTHCDGEAPRLSS